MTAKDVLDYVDRLRYPYRDMVIQERTYRVDHRRHTIACVSHTNRAPLLRELREAAYAGIGGNGTPARGSDRIPIDETAIRLYKTIVDDIANEYFEIVDQLPDPEWEPERILGLWVLALRNQVRDGTTYPERIDEARDTARRWVRLIEGHFNPPRRLELTVERRWEEIRHREVRSYTRPTRRETIVVELVRRVPAPCPQCGARYAFIPDTGARTFALLLEYWELGAQTFGKLQAHCRACEYEWHGESAARDLMVAIDEKDRELVDAGEPDDDTPVARNYVHPVRVAG